VRGGRHKAWVRGGRQGVVRGGRHKAGWEEEDTRRVTVLSSGFRAPLRGLEWGGGDIGGDQKRVAELKCGSVESKWV